MKHNFFRLCISIAILLFSISTIAQSMATGSVADFLNMRNAGVKRNPYLTMEEIDGSAYLNDEFIIGSILTKDNIRYIDVPLRYNIFNDVIEYEMSEGSYLAISDPEKMKEICIGDDVFIYDIKRNKKGEQYGYYKLVEDGRIQLLSRFNIVFKEGTTTTGYKAAEPPKFNRNANSLYLKIGTEEPQQLSKKKDIGRIFGPKAKEVLALMKTEDLNFRKEGDLSKLVNLLNQ
jgi:hypothetical protein